MELKIGFRLGIGYDFLNTLVSVFTLSKYSHVELFLGGESYSATIDSGVRKLNYERFRCEDYTLKTIHISEKQVAKIKEFYGTTKDMKYDWLGIFFREWLPIGWHRKNRYFCAEWVSDALIYANVIPSANYSITKLYEVL